MATTRFETTIKALQEKDGLTAEAGIKNIEGWETYLKGHDAQGVKGIVSDLEKLKTLLEAEKPDGSKIKHLTAKLGKETSALANGDIANAGHIKELGAQLEQL